MRLETVGRAEDPSWDDAVRACGGTVFHSRAWSRYISRSRPNTSPNCFRLVSADGQTQGVALGFRTRSTRRLLAPLTSRLWFDALPALPHGSDAAVRFVELLESHARESGDVELVFGSYGYRGGSEVLRARGYALNERLEFELDLSPSEDDLWKGLEHKRRKNVNKSKRAGVVVEEMSLDEGLSELYRLHNLSWDRIERRGVRRGGLGHARGADVPERELLDSSVGRLIGARLEREWLSVSLFTQFAGQVYHVLSGHSPKALEVQAPTLLLWDSIVRFRADGVRWFNFGGSAASARKPESPEHGVYDYKRAFGGVCLECASGRKFVRSARGVLARALWILAARRGTSAGGL